MSGLSPIRSSRGPSCFACCTVRFHCPRSGEQCDGCQKWTCLPAGETRRYSGFHACAGSKTCVVQLNTCVRMKLGASVQAKSAALARSCCGNESSPKSALYERSWRDSLTTGGALHQSPCTSHLVSIVQSSLGRVQNDTCGHRGAHLQVDK